MVNVAGADQNARVQASLSRLASEREALEEYSPSYPPHLWGPLKVIQKLIFTEDLLSHSAEPERSVCIL